MLAKKGLSAAPSAVAQYVEDVFSTYLYTGNGSTQTITNNIDLSGEGGLVWIKMRSVVGYEHILTDTARGAQLYLSTDNNLGQQTGTNDLTAFTSTGFSLGSSNRVNRSTAGENQFTSWTFRKAKKFFDVVTYTGNGSARTISHNLGSVPGCIIVKQTDTTGAWQVYHRANTANPETDYLVLNTTAATVDSDTRWNDTLPTSTEFSLGTDATVNANSGTYVAYLFAHDAGGFGDAGSDSIIKCGSFTTDASSKATVTLDWEPQFVIYKRATGGTGNWAIIDNMRGMPVGSEDARLLANTSDAENSSVDNISPTATGFSVINAQSASSDFIYIAIRRGPMKTPTAGTEVYNGITRTGTGAAATITGLLTDLIISHHRNNSVEPVFYDRLRGATKALRSNLTNAESTYSTGLTGFDLMNGVTVGADGSGAQINFSSVTYANWMFRRAPGFFDVVCYTGTGANRTVAHNLGVVPELMIIKNRSQADAWAVYAGDNTDYLVLDTTAATADLNTYWNDTSPTSTNFTVGTVHNTNASAENYVAYLFASLAGVSKVGTYTGNGSSVTVTTGFQPRFILVKRTDSTGNWIVGDSARGLVAGDDPYLLLNSTAAEDTDEDWVDVSATGFTVNETAANANVNTGIYLYLAIS